MILMIPSGPEICKHPARMSMSMSKVGCWSPAAGVGRTGLEPWSGRKRYHDPAVPTYGDRATAHLGPKLTGLGGQIWGRERHFNSDSGDVLQWKGEILSSDALKQLNTKPGKLLLRNRESV